MDKTEKIGSHAKAPRPLMKFINCFFFASFATLRNQNSLESRNWNLLKSDISGGSGKGDDIPDVGETRHKLDQPLKAQAEPRMGN